MTLQNVDGICNNPLEMSMAFATTQWHGTQSNEHVRLDSVIFGARRRLDAASKSQRILTRAAARRRSHKSNSLRNFECSRLPSRSRGRNSLDVGKCPPSRVLNESEDVQMESAHDRHLHPIACQASDFSVCEIAVGDLFYSLTKI